LHITCNTGDKRETKGGKETQKPVCVIHYKWMGGSDLKGQLLKMYLVERKLSQMVYAVIQKTSECHSDECNNNL
jgi:hypothetical protein